MQIGTSGLKFAIVWEKVSVADAIRRSNEERVRVDGIDEHRISLRKWLAGYCRIIKRKCRIKSGDSAKEHSMSRCKRSWELPFYLPNMNLPDESFMTSRPINPQR